MGNEQKSLWELESDIFTDYDGTITDASFKFNEFGGQFSITLDEIDGRDAPTWENYKLPPGWESNDGGETIERIAGDKKGFVKSSQYGKWLGAVAGLDGALEALGEEAPTNANAWIGCRFTFEVTELGRGKPYKFEKDGEKMEGVSKDKNYPTAFLGKVKDSVETPVNGNGNGKVDSLSVLTDIPNPVVQSKIQELAKSLPHGEWFKASYELMSTNGLQPAQYPDLVAAMGGRGLYESLGGKG
jgi:hypothetical protein